MNIINKINPEICYGCAGCMNICPACAISMPINNHGFYYPEIDSNLCINCGKCLNVCPSLDKSFKNIKANDKNIFMARASHEEFLKSQSGGLFPVIAKYILSQGGYIAGVKYNEEMMPVFDITNTLDGLEKFRMSKYTQAYVGNIYQKVKEKLDEDKIILFTGLPCQVDALYHYLGKHIYDNLYVIDLWCHGVPSPALWKSYVDEHLDSANITNIMFFNKENAFAPRQMVVEWNNGDRETSPRGRDWYSRLFSRNGLNASCQSCKYAMTERQGDITLGDLWSALHNDNLTQYSIGNIPPAFIMANTDKGNSLIREIAEKLSLFEKIPYEYISDKNRIINVNVDTGYRDKILEKHNIIPMETYDLDKNICLYGLTENVNYGSLITYYALYKAIENLGYTCYMIPRSSSVTEEVDHKRAVDEDSMGSVFCRENCRMAPRLKYEDFQKYNSLANKFVLGSDMIWRYSGYRKWANDTFYLDFVEPGKKKIACGPSFGTDDIEAIFKDCMEDFPKIKSLINDFDAIGMRELSGVEILKNNFGIDKAIQVLDPVFYINREEYDKLAEKAQEKHEPESFVTTYFPSYPKQPKMFLKEHWPLKGERVINMMPPYPTRLEAKNVHLEDFVDMYQWLYNIKNCKYVITASFHAVCFCLIFNKPFIFLKDHWGLTRIETLDKLFSIQDRIVDIAIADTFDVENTLKRPMNWDEINKNIKLHSDKSINWLENALSNG